jgi:hypothetical protein
MKKFCLLLALLVLMSAVRNYLAKNQDWASDVKSRAGQAAVLLPMTLGDMNVGDTGYVYTIYEHGGRACLPRYGMLFYAGLNDIKVTCTREGFVAVVPPSTVFHQADYIPLLFELTYYPVKIVNR